MSVEQQESTIATNNPLKAGIGWVVKHWPRIRLAQEGMMLEKINRQNRIVETLARNTMTGDTKDMTGWPGNEGDDKMGVSIGDQTHYHQSTPSAPSKLLPYVVAAAAITGGFYLGTQQAVIPEPSQQPTNPVNYDKDSYGIELRRYVPE